MILALATLIAVASAYWDFKSIGPNKLNHWIHGGARVAAYVVGAFLLGADLQHAVAYWFLVVITHRFALNAFMGWDAFYIGKTAIYDKSVRWIAGLLDIDEPGQMIVAAEAAAFVLLMVL